MEKHREKGTAKQAVQEKEGLRSPTGPVETYRFDSLEQGFHCGTSESKLSLMPHLHVEAPVGLQ